MEDINKKLDTALNNRNQADYECYMALREIITNCDPEVLIDLLADYNGGERDFAEDLINNAKEMMEVREKYNNEFMKLLSEASIKPTKGK